MKKQKVITYPWWLMKLYWFFKKNIYLFRILISALFLLSAFSKLYPTPMYGITKVFEEGQLIPMGFSESIAPYFSRFIIGAEFFLAIAILFSNYLKKIIVPLAFIMIAVFSIHLSTQIFGDSENCGCFGDLIPMTPLQALIKNILTLIILTLIYKTSENTKGNLSNLVILFLSISTIMFAWLPVSSQSKNIRTSSFSSHVISDDFDINKGRKILCFFDAGCEHCQESAKELKDLSDKINNFPEVHIIFSDAEEYNIPKFFEFAGKEFSYQVMPFYLEDDEVNSYLEVLGYEYENPAIIYLEDGNQMRFYDGTGNNEFNAEELRRILENE